MDIRDVLNYVESKDGWRLVHGRIRRGRIWQHCPLTAMASEQGIHVGVERAFEVSTSMGLTDEEAKAVIIAADNPYETAFGIQLLKAAGLYSEAEAAAHEEFRARNSELVAMQSKLV